METNSPDIIAVLPFAALISIALTMLLLDLFGWRKTRLPWILTALLAAWVSSFPQLSMRGSAFNGLILLGPLSWVFYSIILGAAALSFLISGESRVKERAITSIDVDVLLLLAVCGALMMVSAAHLLVLFLGFELLSISVYVLCAIARTERASAEAALKYFLLGAFSSAFLLYGMVLIYASSGTMMLSQLNAQEVSGNSIFIIGLGFILFGLGFKASLVPFHVWTPDVYQGAPTSITMFMAAVVKVAAFAALMRLLLSGLGNAAHVWIGVLWTMSVLSMSIANLAALCQRSIKRMLAYSSIAHAGYALMALLIPGNPAASAALIFYLLVYSLMTLGTFGVVLLISRGTDAQYEKDDLNTLNNVGWSQPVLGLTMSVCVLSLAGFPPLAGFFGKLFLFSAALHGGYLGLVIIAAINSVIALYYYLRVLVVMYFGTETETSTPCSGNLGFVPSMMLGLISASVILLGFFSSGCLALFESAIR